MGRPRDASRREEIVAEYERQVKANGSTTYADVRAKVKASYVYVSQVIKSHRDAQTSKGTLKPCLNYDKCGNMVFRTKERWLCDYCRESGEYIAPYSVSRALHMGAGR